MPTSNERKMLNSNEALKELKPNSLEAIIHRFVITLKPLRQRENSKYRLSDD